MISWLQAESHAVSVSPMRAVVLKRERLILLSGRWPCSGMAKDFVVLVCMGSLDPSILDRMANGEMVDALKPVHGAVRGNLRVGIPATWCPALCNDTLR